MSAHKLSRFTLIALLLFGATCWYARYRGRAAALKAVSESRWRLTYDIGFRSDADDAEVRVAIPHTDPHVTVLNPQFILKRLGAREVVRPQSGTRELVLTPPHIDDYHPTIQFDLLLTPEGNLPNQWRKTGLSAAARSRFLQRSEEIPTLHNAVRDELTKAPANLDENEFVQWIFEQCSQRIRPGTSSGGGDSVIHALGHSEATPLGRARTMVTLCRAARFPARLVSGFELRQSRDGQAQPRVWVEVYREHQWIPFDPENGFQWRLPNTYLPIRWGGEKIITDKGAEAIPAAGTDAGGESPSNAEVVPAEGDAGADVVVEMVPRVDDAAPAGNVPWARYSIIALPPSAQVLQSDARSFLQILDLTRLPMEMHEVMALLLLLPLGALVTAVFRNIVGIRTFGTFAPALLALSFVYAAWGTGLVILVIVVTAGATGRSLIERLHLLMVPRRSIILTLIILALVFCVSFLDFIQLTPSAQAVLLPLVILTTLIERMYVTTEEDGAAFSFQLAVGTLVVATCCYLLLRWEEVGEVILAYPELHCFTLAMFIFIGRYTGYRLTEWWRFSDLVKSDESR